jgi:hypothetical protein
MAASESGADAAAPSAARSSAALAVPAHSPPPTVSVTPAASPPSRPPLGAASAASSAAPSPAASFILQRPANAAAPRLSSAAHSSLAVALARPPPLVRRTLSGSKGAGTSAELSDAVATGASGSLLLSVDSESEGAPSAGAELSAPEEARPGLTSLPSASGSDLASRLRHAIEGELPNVSVDEAEGSSEADTDREPAGRSSHEAAQDSGVAQAPSLAASDAEPAPVTGQQAASVAEGSSSEEPSAGTGWGWSTLTTLPTMPPSLKISAPSLKRLGLGGYSASSEASDTSSIDSAPGPSGLRRWWGAPSPVSSETTVAEQASSPSAAASSAQPPQPKLPRGSFPVSKPRKKSSAAQSSAGESRSGRAEASSSRTPVDAADVEAQAKAKAREERRRRRELEKVREEENISETGEY